MAFNIDEFKSSIDKTNGFSYAHTYTMEINKGPKLIQGISSEVKDNIRYRCDSVLLPARSITTSDTKYGTWENRKSGFAANYLDVNCSIILSSNLRERDYLLAWQDIIVGKHRLERQDSSSDAARKAFNTGYYDDYIGEVTIKKYELDAKNSDDWTYKCILKDAFPININPQQTSWETIEVEKLNVIWSYYYMIDEYKGRFVPEGKKRATGFFNSLFAPERLFNL